ncbi:hypothetical protein MM326_06810 [Alkalihalobacillus sp. LMS6]|uniref:hypothetical protein n=1 Tax=Alkalihalobacillus sp. LMS6 TaxID=2924034 RepID=UPI0020D1C097|nr:hypothetical protein [Alkalihalobacillus sp. LMS6]UTR07718.1 hypothetical protein MM326_06810 [Alkalihalobacillus sp. LMS6]
MKLSNQYEDARQHLQNARDIQNGWANFLLEHKTPLNEQLKEINQDKHLTTAGKLAKTDAARKEAGIEALKKMQTRKEQYVAELTKANKIADKVFYKKPKAPDAVTLERFNDRLREVKTQLALGSNESQSKQLLNSFVSSIKDPYLASLIRDDFLSLSQNIVGIAGNAAKAKSDMAKIYEGLREDFETEEVKGARQILEYTSEQIENPKISNDGGLFSEKAVELFGKEIGQFIRNPEDYFATNPEEKPEEYVDEELEADTKAHKQEADFAETVSNISATTEEKESNGQLNI